MTEPVELAFPIQYLLTEENLPYALQEGRKRSLAIFLSHPAVQSFMRQVRHQGTLQPDWLTRETLQRMLSRGNFDGVVIDPAPGKPTDFRSTKSLLSDSGSAS
jgi:hypothetical protein